MSDSINKPRTRRGFLQAAAILPAALFIAGTAGAFPSPGEFTNPEEGGPRRKKVARKKATRKKAKRKAKKKARRKKATRKKATRKKATRKKAARKKASRKQATRPGYREFFEQSIPTGEYESYAPSQGYESYAPTHEPREIGEALESFDRWSRYKSIR